jgi:pyrroloquinoline quinone biosynthesis protein B
MTTWALGALALTPPLHPSIPSRGPFLLVVGTAQDGGIPHVSCSCDRCSAARRDPARARRVASLAILFPGSDRAFLIDATPDVRPQLDAVRAALGRTGAGTDRRPLAGVFLTHAHMGHYLGLAFFGFEALHTGGMPVWGSPRMVGFLSKHGPWEQLVRLGNIEPRPLDDGAVADLGEGVRLRAVRVPHRDEYTDTLAFRIEGPRRTILYMPDADPWERWPTPVEDLFGGVDVALLDGCFYSLGELPGRDLASIGHPLITSSMDRFAKTAAAKPRVLFTHLNHSNPALDPGGPERREIARRGFALLEDGDTWDL